MFAKAMEQRNSEQNVTYSLSKRKISNSVDPVEGICLLL